LYNILEKALSIINNITGSEGGFMERTVVKKMSFKEAEEADILQQISMTPEERQKIAKFLKIKVYGSDSPDIRDQVRKSG